jgi:hypothetical protein
MGAGAMCCLGADPPFIRSAVLREDHHNCDDNAQTDEVFRKAASTLFFMHIRSSMQAHGGEIRYYCRVGTDRVFPILDFPPGAPAFWISKHTNLGRDCQEDSAIGPDIPSLLSPSFSTSLRKARRSSCRNRTKDDPQSELQLLKLRIGTRGYMGSA